MSDRAAVSAPESSHSPAKVVRGKPRRYSDLVKWEPPVQLTKVSMYEVADEIEDDEILETLAEYGEIVGGITRHKHKGYDVENGVRSVVFYKEPKNIPGTIRVDGNKVKVRYDTQDRTPICSICKTKGHYKNFCKKNKEVERVSAEGTDGGEN